MSVWLVILRLFWMFENYQNKTLRVKGGPLNDPQATQSSPGGARAYVELDTSALCPSQAHWSNQYRGQRTEGWALP